MNVLPSPTAGDYHGPVRPQLGASELLSCRVSAQVAPAMVMFQVTDRCNYSCVHCCQTHGHAPELTLDEIDRILGEIAQEGGLMLTLLGGEMWMRPDADDILRVARKKRFAVRIITTGHFIDEARADLIRSLGSIEVALSLYADAPQIHDSITRMTGSWERTMAAARRLRNRGVGVLLKAPLMAQNAASLRGVARIAREMGAGFQFDPRIAPRDDGWLGPTACRPDEATVRSFYADETIGVWPTIASLFGQRREQFAPKRREDTSCRAGVDLVSIAPQGLVFACNTLPVPCGDLRTQSFRDVWRESPQMKRIRGLTWSQLNVCKDCDVRGYCARCHGHALAEDGDMQGPSSEACRHAVILRDLLRDRGLASAAAPGAESSPAAGIKNNSATKRILSIRVE